MTGIPPNYELNYSRNAMEFYTDLLIELKTTDRAIEKVLELNK